MIKLFIRFYIGITLAVIAAITAGGIMLDSQYQQTLAQDHRMYSSAVHDIVNSTLKQYPVEQWQTQLNILQQKSPYQLTFTALSQLTPTQREQLQSQGVAIDITTDILGDEATLHYPITGTDQALRYTAKNATNPEYDWLFIASMLLLMLMLAIAVYWLAKPISHHINQLVKVSQQIGKGQLQARADPRGPAPLNELAATMNRMSEQIARLLKQQEVMTGAVAHELRAPLANLRFALDMTHSHKDINALQSHLAEMDQDIDDMDQLIDELLTYARLNNAPQAGAGEEIAISPLLKNLLDKRNKLLPGIHIELQDNCPPAPACRIYGAKNEIGRAITNVITNAQRYARKHIRVALTQDGPWCLITIDDDGKGIAPEDWQDIFIPFKRLESGKEQQTNITGKGYGLGLAIVERIMLNHKGNVTVEQSPLGGARFVLSFPCQKDIDQASRALPEET
ncbi:HAMP domain-containing protein [Thalassomonas viridans]|uniref:histidine kinase n=1 Tax=Thalassomonas viridans TaxID=137584 RepID=A0AAE9YZP7_9GAMM|nr:ATP-binding protein [Thalassomonas viridans]WDE04151.1 HAMP domain-containing protein [Thalassomonas viridans]